MNHEKVIAMKEKLMAIKEELLRKLGSESNEFQEIIQNMDVKDMADFATDSIDQQTLEIFSSQEKRKLSRIDAALGRIENGNYGICAQCSGKIRDERLEAIPYSLLCIKCQTANEKKRR